MNKAGPNCGWDVKLSDTLSVYYYRHIISVIDNVEKSGPYLQRYIAYFSIDTGQKKHNALTAQKYVATK